MYIRVVLYRHCIWVHAFGNAGTPLHLPHCFQQMLPWGSWRLLSPLTESCFCFRFMHLEASDPNPAGAEDTQPLSDDAGAPCHFPIAVCIAAAAPLNGSTHSSTVLQD